MATNETPTLTDAARLALRALPADEIISRMAEFYSAFSDPGRVKIISALHAAGELCVKEIAAVAGASESAVSHQLKILRLMRLIAPRSDGRLVYYHLDDEHIFDIVRAGRDHVEEKESIRNE